MCNELPIVFTLVPPLNPVVLCTTCGEPLTLEMELDEGECVDCMADRAKSAEERIPA